MYNMTFGYARVSTEGQCLDRQIDALKAAGVQEEYIYKGQHRTINAPLP